jgi:hypothetical protein
MTTLPLLTGSLTAVVSVVNKLIEGFSPSDAPNPSRSR